MPITSDDFDSAWMEAQAQFENWKREFEAEFYGPEVEAEVRLRLSQVTPEQAAMLAEQAPDEYEQMMDFMGGRHG